MEPVLNKSCIFCVVLIFFCPAVTARGRVIYVDDDGPADFNNIQAAIDDANDGDVVNVADGVYTGDGNWDINFKGKAVTVRSANGPENCVIDCMAPGWTDHRGFVFRSGEDNRSVLSGFTVTNGRGYWGGGILCDGSSPTIQNNIITGNAARGDGEIPGLGGGIYCGNSYAVIVGNVIANNGAGFGGGICARNSSLTLRNNLFGRNHASGTSVIFCCPGRGGAIDCVRSSLVLINNTILSNYAHATYCWGGIPGEGGGIHCGDSAVTVLNSILWGNDPAALWVDDDSTVEIRYSDIQGGWLGKGNVDADPCFATVASWVEPLEPNILDDWHLKSQAGRFDSISGSWVYDEVTSPCIDAGDPNSPIGNEPFPNGGIVNIGACGGTLHASKSYFGSPICETVIAGDINGDCKVDFLDLAILASHWFKSHNPDIELDFQQALQMIPTEPKWPNGIMYYDMEEAVDSFVSKHSDPATVSFLQTKMEDARFARLALFCLANVAPKDQNAKKVLYEQIDRRNSAAIVTIAYLDPADARPMGEEVLAISGRWTVRVAAANMLIGLGDQNSLELLERISETESNHRVVKALKSAIQELRYRFEQVPPELRDEWARQELLCWRTMADKVGPPSITDYGDESSAAKTLHMQAVQLSREYLEYKLSMGDILVIDVIGYQKEAWAIPDLGSYAALEGGLGKSARAALARIGTNEALRTLEDSLLPAAPSTVFTHVMSLLRQYGDQTSAEFAKRLSSDQRFSERERRSLQITYEIIEKRLAKQ